MQELELEDGTQSGKSIASEIENRDNILQLIEFTKDNNHFENKNENTEFIVGLKLFSEVIRIATCFRTIYEKVEK